MAAAEHGAGPEDHAEQAIRAFGIVGGLGGRMLAAIDSWRRAWDVD
jgi:hypothetical protein